MREDEDDRWWTVPQATVWIRTRDFPAVQALDNRQKTSLFMAADMIPGVFPAATDCLREAVKRGRLAVRGRLARLELAIADGTPAWRLLGDGLAFVPESLWRSGGEFTDDLEHGVMAMAPGTPERWEDLVVAIDDCIGHWQPPGSLLAQTRMPMSRVLPLGPDDVPEWLLAHPDVLVTGVDGSGARVPVERGMFNDPLRVDRDNGVLMTNDGQMTWRALELEFRPSRTAGADAAPLARWHNRPAPAPLEQGPLATPRAPTRGVDAAPQTDAPRAPRRAGQKGYQRAAASAFIMENYPNGVPDNVSVSAIEAALKARGTPVSARTIRRAMRAR